MTLSRICLQEHLYLLYLICSKKFHVDQSISNEMSQLRIDAKYKISIPILIDIWKDNIILQSLNMQSLSLHSSLKAYPNLQATLLGKFNVLSCYDGHGTIIFFHDNMKLSKSCIFTNSSAEFITPLFNGNTSSPMNIITTCSKNFS